MRTSRQATSTAACAILACLAGMFAAATCPDGELGDGRPPPPEWDLSIVPGEIGAPHVALEVDGRIRRLRVYRSADSVRVMPCEPPSAACRLVRVMTPGGTYVDTFDVRPDQGRPPAAGT